jgi:hypothetical protein
MPRQIIPADNAAQVAPPPTSKRKARKLGLNAKGQPIKRRASKACQICRARKVRCDVVEHGAPCSNCKSGAIPCTVPETKHKKYVSKKDSKALINSDLIGRAPSKLQESTATIAIHALVYTARCRGQMFPTAAPIRSISPVQISMTTRADAQAHLATNMKVTIPLSICPILWVSCYKVHSR